MGSVVDILVAQRKPRLANRRGEEDGDVRLFMVVAGDRAEWWLEMRRKEGRSIRVLVCRLCGKEGSGSQPLTPAHMPNFRDLAR